MDWINEINNAMEALISACKKNDSWANCHYCPFDEYCTVCDRNGLGTPNEWNDESNNE